MAQDFTVDRNSPKWVLGSDGYLKEYANDEAAIEFNADGSYKGVLVEPQSVNEALQSETFSAWNATNATLATNTGGSPKNDNYKILVPDNGASANTSRITDVLPSTTGAMCFSVFAKSEGFNRLNLRVNIGGSTTNTIFNTDTGTVISGTGGSVREIGNGWYRFSVVKTETSTTNRTFEIRIDNAGNGTDGIGIYGAQVEQSPVATSYIPTTTGAVTRLKDDIFFANASSVIGQSEGTLFVEVDWQLMSGATQWIFSVNDSTFTNRVLLLKSAVDEYIDARVYKSGSAVWNEPYTSSLSGIQKIALTYSATGGKMYVNGSEVLDDTNDLSFSAGTLTDVNFGQSVTSSGQSNMWFRAVALFTTRLSDAECEALTTI